MLTGVGSVFSLSPTWLRDRPRSSFSDKTPSTVRCLDLCSVSTLAEGAIFSLLARLRWLLLKFIFKQRHWKRTSKKYAFLYRKIIMIIRSLSIPCIHWQTQQASMKTLLSDKNALKQYSSQTGLQVTDFKLEKCWKTHYRFCSAKADEVVCFF